MSEKENNVIFFETVLKEAQLGKRICKPNPSVGAVIVYKGNIIGAGHTQGYGEAHAEVMAIKAAERYARYHNHTLQGAHLFVSLTPCCHHGKTPPCTVLIQQHHFAHVHIANIDTHVFVKDKTHRIFNTAGIRYSYDFPNEIALQLFELNYDYFYHLHYKKPCITIKYAMSLDGKIASQNSKDKWISSKLSRLHVHLERAHHDAILIGARTFFIDNPKLTVRYLNKTSTCFQPLRIVLFTRDVFKLKKKRWHLLNQAKAKTVFLLPNNATHLHALAKQNKVETYSFLHTSNLQKNIKTLLTEVANRFNLNSIYIEGGSATHALFWQAECCNKVSVYVSPIILGSGVNALHWATTTPWMTSTKKLNTNLVNSKVERLHNDYHFTGYNSLIEYSLLKKKALGK